MLLRKRGPTTEGVFRKPCNNKNMREVRDRLNKGLEVDMKSQPVALLVGLLKVCPSSDFTFHYLKRCYFVLLPCMVAFQIK